MSQQPYPSHPYGTQPPSAQQFPAQQFPAQQFVVQPYAGPAYPDHPRGTTVLVLGILALSVFVTGPFAWYIGTKVKKEIAAGGQHYGNERDVEIGRLIGMVATLFWAGVIVVYVIIVVAFVGIFASVLANFPR